MLHIDNLLKIGPQKGSNKGGTYIDGYNNSYYVKFSATDSHARNEVLAARLYKLCGVAHVDLDFLDLGDGKLGTISPMIAAKVDLAQRLNDQKYLSKIRAGFAVDAWLANWDVVGLVYDNIVSDANDEPVRVDPGGALNYRAQGAPKGNAFGDEVGEWETLRFNNPQSSRVFSSMTDSQLDSSLYFVTSLSSNDIYDVVDSIGFPSNSNYFIATKLIRRRNYLIEKAAQRLTYTRV